MTTLRWCWLCFGTIAALYGFTYALGTGFIDPWGPVLVLALLAVTLLLVALHVRWVRAQAHRQQVFITALGDVSSTLNDTRRATDLDTLLDQILSHARSVVPYDFAAILLLEEQTARLLRCQPAAPLPYANSHLMVAEHDVLQQVQARRQPLRLEVDQDSSKHFPGQSARLVVPMLAQGVMLGFVDVYAWQSGAFSPLEIMRLQAFANQAAIAIKSVQVNDVLVRATAQLDALFHATSFLLNAHQPVEMGQQIAQAVRRQFADAACSVLLVDWGTGMIRELAYAGATRSESSEPLHVNDGSLIATAVRQGTVIASPVGAQCNGTRPCPQLVVPLLRQGAVLGVLHLQSTATDAFTDLDRQILAVFADRAAIALENMQLYEQLHAYALDREQQVIERTTELSRVKERVEVILDSTSDAIMLTRPDGRIQQGNRAFRAMFGYDYDETFEWPLDRLIAPEYAQALERALSLAARGQPGQHVELRACRQDGSQFDADLMLSPIFSRDDNGTWGVICSLRDISERKQMELNLRLALDKERELHELKNRFVSMASHEFRTPLATIMTTTDLLESYSERMDEAKKQQQFDKIKKQIYHMTGLLSDVLTIGRIDAGKMRANLETVDLCAFFDELAEESQQNQVTHTIRFACDGRSLPILADKALLRKIVMNLLANAIKYSPEGSTVTFTLHFEPERVRFSVRDEGIGIPLKDQAHLFQPFHRAGNVGTIPGTGLGLAIIKHAVELHGGQITFTSQVNQGTTFTVELPVVEEELIR
jgi:PAS domain S-box-containing protein